MKITTMEKAISASIQDGDSIHLAGFVHQSPFAAGHEIIRQEKSDLTLSRLSPDLIYDQLIAAGCPTKLIFSFASGEVRRMLQDESSNIPQLEYEEYTHYGLAARLAAGARDLPFNPVNTFVGSDLPEYNDNLRIVESPFDGEEIYAVPPLNPDVTVVHGARADTQGNAQGWGIIGETRDAVFAADTVVLSVEEIVDDQVIRGDPNRTVFPGSAVDYLVEEPFGAHPSYVQGYYDRDRSLYQEWNEIAETREGIEEWLDEWVYGVKDRVEYLEKLGVSRILGLDSETNYTTTVDMGGYQ